MQQQYPVAAFAPQEVKASVRCLGLVIAACSCEQKVNYRYDAGDPYCGGPPPSFLARGLITIAAAVAVIHSSTSCHPHHCAHSLPLLERFAIAQPLDDRMA